MSNDVGVIGFIGGTGPEGRGLALRFAQNGHDVLLGSRDSTRAEREASRVAALTDAASVGSGFNHEVALGSDIVFLTVPYAVQREVLHDLRSALDGKVAVAVAAPLTFEDGIARAVLVEEGSAALHAQAVLSGSRVVGAFQTVSASDLLQPDKSIDSDVVVCADDPESKQSVMYLAEEIKGVRAVDGGGLENAGHLESFTALLINLNRIYKARSSIKISGI